MLLPRIGCIIDGATSHAGSSTKRRNAIRGCGNTRCPSLETISPYSSRSRSRDLAPHRTSRVRPAATSIAWSSLRRTEGASAVSKSATALRKAPCPAGPPTGCVMWRLLTLLTVMASLTCNAETALSIARDRSPRFVPILIRQFATDLLRTIGEMLKKATTWKFRFHVVATMSPTPSLRIRLEETRGGHPNHGSNRRLSFQSGTAPRVTHLAV